MGQYKAKTMQETAEELQRRVMELLAMEDTADDSSSSRLAAADYWPSLDPETPISTTTTMRDPSLTLLLPLLILLSTLLFLLIVFLVFLIVLKRKRRSGIALLDTDGPIDLAREEELEGEGGLAGVEERWLEQQDSSTRTGYERAKLWQQQYLPNSMSTDITLSQFLSIQEKGVSAWSFEPDYETNSPLFVTSRTEVTFLEDGAGMAAQEGGACCVQSNLPLPRINEVYYWECKIFEKPESTNIAIGLSTKPYPTFRMPGWNRYSIGYFSADGFKCHNYPFAAQSYGPPLAEGDVLGVGYRPRTGAVFFTRNGKKLDDAYIGLTKHNLFPTVAADGAATIHVNLGQAGFVFIEANVKKWGLAPTIGTLAPPPAYGSERGSILLETAGGPQAGDSMAGNAPLVPPPQLPHHQRQRSDEAAAVAALTSPSDSHDAGSSSSSRTRNPTHRRVQSHSTAPLRPSPLRTSMTRQRTSSYTGSVNSASSSPVSIPGTLQHDDHEHHDYYEGQEENDELLPHNPPTPGQTDISLRAMSPFSRRRELEDRAERLSQSLDQSTSTSQRPPSPPTSSTPPYHDTVASSSRTTSSHAPRNPGDVSPPSYQLIDANQYPAGVAEAMLETMPEDQFAALFAHAANASQDRSRSSSSSNNAQGSFSQSQGGNGEQQSLGLRGLLNGVFGRSTSNSESTSSSNV